MKRAQKTADKVQPQRAAASQPSPVPAPAHDPDRSAEAKQEPPSPSSNPQSAIANPQFAELLRSPAVKDWLGKQLEASDREARLGPGGSWAFGNESKRAGINQVNALLRALAQIAAQ